MSGKRSVTFRFLSNPDKYNALIKVLAGYEDEADFFSSDLLRSVYKSVFTRPPSTDEILQLRNFIAGRKHKISHHIQ